MIDVHRQICTVASVLCIIGFLLSPLSAATHLESIVILTQPINRTVLESGRVSFSISTRRDSVTFQWWKIPSIGGPAGAISGATDSILTLSHVPKSDSGSTYYCYLTNRISSKQSATVRLDVTKFANPFRMLSVRRPDPHDTARVTLTIVCDQGISALINNPLVPMTDALEIGYASKNWLQSIDTNSLRSLKIRTSEFADKDTLVKSIQVASLPAGHDSTYYFSISTLWHKVSAVGDSLTPPAPGGKVFMLDTIPPSNTVAVAGSYYKNSDSVKLSINAVATLDSLTQGVKVSFYPAQNLSVAIIDTLFKRADLQSKAVAGIYSCTIKHPLFYGTKDSVYCRWSVIGRNNVASSPGVTSFAVGGDAPVFAGSLSATALRSDWVRLQWSGTLNVDSIRVCWGADTVPLGLSPDPLQHTFKSYNPTLTFDTLKGLSANRTYFFAIQIFKSGLISAVSPGARAVATTPDWDTLKIENTITIDDARFDASKNSLDVRWHYDTVKKPAGMSLEYGWVISLNPAVQDTPTKWAAVDYDRMSSSILIGPDIVFDTTYSIALWLRGVGTSGAGAPSKPSPSGRAQVKVGSFTWQVVRYFPSDTAVYANNSKFVLLNVAATFADTLRPYTPTIQQLAGMAFSTAGFYFVKAEQFAAITIGIRYGQLPPGVDPQRLRIYRDSSGVLLVERGSVVQNGAVWVKTRFLQFPFIVLADTSAPRVSLDSAETDTSTILAPGTPVVYKGVITDNIGNTRWKIQYARGVSAFVAGNADSATGSNLSVSFVHTIPGAVVSEAYGLRVWLIVDDGVNRDTIDYSRRVRTNLVADFSFEPKKWKPLSVAAFMDVPAVATALSVINPKGLSEYNTTDFRLFRWMEDFTGVQKWIEYSDVIADFFSIIPGRQLWLKTDKATTFSLKNGVTPSLKQPFDIMLQPGKWTDFSLPFKFSVELKDVIEANPGQVDSLYIYHWTEDTLFHAELVYAKFIPSTRMLADTFTMAYLPFKDAYTVYNASLSAMNLKIPPISEELSATLPKQAKRNAMGEMPSWDISVAWRPAQWESFSSSIRCGYDGRVKERPSYYPLPPSFLKMGVGVLDTAYRNICGNVMSHELNKGGTEWELCFFNNEATAQTIQYRLDNLTALPAGMKAAIVGSGANAAPETSPVWQDIAIAPNSTQRRWVVVGDDSYLARFRQAHLIGAPALLRPYLNPAGGRVTIKYAVPSAGLSAIFFNLYNLQGREVWTHRVGSNLSPGTASCIWDGRERAGRPAAAGMYILRMLVVDTKGLRSVVGEERIAYLP
jgi:hypothetical protein